VQNPDAVLTQRHRGDVVATSDAWILDHCERWIDLPASLLTADLPPPSAADAGPVHAARPDLWLLDLDSPADASSGIGGP
jgi:hypothetical protein